MIDDEGRKRLSEGMETLLSLQRRFQTEHGFDFWKQGPEKRREMFLRTLFAAISELSEAGDEVNKWWKKGSREPESIVKKRDEILEEMIDALHFFLVDLVVNLFDQSDDITHTENA